MALTTKDKFEYWLNYARNDLDTADFMFKSGRWFYTLFMCQQAIEKLTKGLYILYFELKRRYNNDICLEPNAFPLSELNNDNPFVKEILRTGMEIV